MKFALMVSEGPYTHQAADTAWNFASAAIAKGHEVMRVFFYHDGVYNATRLTEPPQDDRNIVNHWSKLAEEHGTDLVVCVAAGLRRGLVLLAAAAREQRHGARHQPVDHPLERPAVRHGQDEGQRADRGGADRDRGRRVQPARDEQREAAAVVRVLLLPGVLGVGVIAGGRGLRARRRGPCRSRSSCPRGRGTGLF